MDRNKSKYSYEDRKHIRESIENLRNDDDYVAIFEILMDDPSNTYSQNSNGIFLNLSVVSDNTLDKITKYLKKINKKRFNEIEMDVDIIPNSNVTKSEKMYKLSNYEKNILKQRNLKKVLNEEIDYDEMKFTAKKKKTTKSKTSSKKKYREESY